MDMIVPRLPSPPPTPAPPEASLTTQERLRLAKRRRAAQLKRWAQRERERNHPDLVMNARGGFDAGPPPRKVGRGRGNITFVSDVMLLESAARNDVEEVRRLLEVGVSPDSTNEDGLTALHQCCIDDSEEMMKALVAHGADVNATDTEKWTPLHAAATCGHLHLVKFLIDRGADLLAVNADGNMPYDLCEDDTTLSYIENEMARRGVTQELIDDTRAETERRMLRDLQSAPSDFLEAKDHHGATPLHIASANGYLSVVEYLLDNHVSTESVDNDMWQPIHAAACWGHLEVVEMLAQNGANISARTKNGETPFDICEDPEIKERLIQLKEQRVRLDQPRVRRTRSASTRTQSIRRTSLREKMNTTKKDVQDEKLFFIQSFDPMPKSENGSDGASANGEGPLSPSKGVVDVNDVEILLPSGWSNKSGDDQMDDRRQPTLPPRRPPRMSREGASPSSPPDASSSSPSPVVSASSTNLPGSDKINIHVSVTINAPPGGGGSVSGPPSEGGDVAQTPETPPPPSSAVHLGGGGNSGTTLSDLKKARSMSRSIQSPTSPSVPASDPRMSASPHSGLMSSAGVDPSPPPPPRPQNKSRAPPPQPTVVHVDPPSPDRHRGRHHRGGSGGRKANNGGGKRRSGRRRDGSPDKQYSSEGSSRDSLLISSDPTHAPHGAAGDIQRFSAGTNEVVGPPPKKTVGCCSIM